MNNGEEPNGGECSTSLAKVKTSESEVLQHPWPYPAPLFIRHYCCDCYECTFAVTTIALL